MIALITECHTIALSHYDSGPTYLTQVGNQPPGYMKSLSSSLTVKSNFEFFSTSFYSMTTS